MMKAMGLAATAADGVFATRLAADGFTGPSGTLEWLATGALIADASPVSLAQRTVATCKKSAWSSNSPILHSPLNRHSPDSAGSKARMRPLEA
jgi:hypothetical protein